MTKATDDDRRTILELLTQSFEENQSVNYIIQQDDKRQARIRALMDYSVSVCSMFGEVWLSNDKKACALILYPHLKRVTWMSVYLDLKLILRAIGLYGIKKAMKREVLIKAKQPKDDLAYLWFIGVHPLYQGSGIGSNLLLEVIADAEKKGLPLFLETSTSQNIAWYRRFGFQVYDQLQLTYLLYFLKNEIIK